MTKTELQYILNLYQDAENVVRHLDIDFGICLWNSKKENFYNKYNLIIRKLFEQIYSIEICDLIESYLFDNINMTFDELYNIINSYE